LFINRTTYNPRCFYRSELPPLPKTWQQLQTYPYKEGFLAAADKEYKALKAKGTFEVIKIKDIGKAYIILNI
jgi:hypothetical protein